MRYHEERPLFDSVPPGCTRSFFASIMITLFTLSRSRMGFIDMLTQLQLVLMHMCL